MTHIIVIFTLLQWSGTRLSISLRYGRTLIGSCAINNWNFIQGCKDCSTSTNQSTGYITLKNEGLVLYDYLNRCIKIIWQNSASIYDKKWEWGTVLQLHTGLIW